MPAESQVAELERLPEVARQAVEALVRAIGMATGSPQGRLDVVHDVERELARFTALVRN